VFFSVVELEFSDFDKNVFEVEQNNVFEVEQNNFVSFSVVVLEFWIQDLFMYVCDRKSKSLD
jgi:hypothetical protein